MNKTAWEACNRLVRLIMTAKYITGLYKYIYPWGKLCKTHFNCK